jgi:hypothetical protein
MPAHGQRQAGIPGSAGQADRLPSPGPRPRIRADYCNRRARRRAGRQRAHVRPPRRPHCQRAPPRLCSGRAARGRRRALRTSSGPSKAVAARRQEPAASRSPGPPTPRPPVHPGARFHLPHHTGPCPWLQFWLQFTTVRAMPGGYAPQVTDFPGLARTVDPRPFNPWVQGSSPWRPTRSELQESLATGLAMPAWRGTTRSAASAHTMHTVHYLRIRRVTDPRFRARGGRLKRSGAGSTMSGRTTRDADHGCATMGDHDRKSSGRRFRAMAEHAARRARHSRQCHGLAGPPVPVRLSGRTDS